MPFTRIQGAEAPATPVDPSASALTQMLQGGLSQPMNSQESAASYGTDPREAFGGGFGRAIGLVSGEDPRYQRLSEAHPYYNAAGLGTGVGVDLGMMATGAPAVGRGALAAARAAPAAGMRVGEVAARTAGHPAVYGTGGLAALLAGGGLEGATAIWSGGPIMRLVGEMLQARRMGNMKKATELGEQIMRNKDKLQEGLDAATGGFRGGR